MSTPLHMQKTETVDTYVRAGRILIDNPLNGTPSIHFVKEQVMTIGGEQHQLPAGSVSEAFTDPTTQFPLINPTNGETIGTASYADLQVLLFSLFFALENKAN